MPQILQHTKGKQWKAVSGTTDLQYKSSGVPDKLCVMGIPG